MITTDAWVLRPAAAGETGPAELVRETLRIAEPGADEVLAEPLYGCFEGNMGHALRRKPIDLCQERREPWVVLGNAGVVRILRAGPDVTTLREGDAAMLFPAAVVDRYGYPEKIFAYDAPGTVGLLARRTVLPGRCVIPIPDGSMPRTAAGHPEERNRLAQWAAFSVRYVTAWSNWSVAVGTLRQLLDEQELPSPHVWGWGGGTALAELELAQRAGCRAVMLGGHDRRLAEIVAAGITPLDRRAFGDLGYDERRFTTDLAYRRSYARAEAAFLAEVAARTGGEGVHVFVDHIGGSVVRATLKALARQGVIATAGWKDGQVVALLRAMECIQRHQHVHTHYARYREGVAAVRYAEAHGWMPRLDGPITRFDDVPELARRYLAGDHGLFPVFSIQE